MKRTTKYKKQINQLKSKLEREKKTCQALLCLNHSPVLNIQHDSNKRIRRIQCDYIFSPQELLLSENNGFDVTEFMRSNIRYCDELKDFITVETDERFSGNGVRFVATIEVLTPSVGKEE